MTTVNVVLLISLIVTATLVVAWLDAKHGWQLTAWMNGQVSNPFDTTQGNNTSTTLSEKDKQIQELKERIQVLEKIVTEPAYELNQKLNRL